VKAALAKISTTDRVSSKTENANKEAALPKHPGNLSPNEIHVKRKAVANLPNGFIFVWHELTYEASETSSKIKRRKKDVCLTNGKQ